MKKLFPFVFVCFLSLSALAQSAVSQFKAEELNENVYLTWSIKQGFTCNGVEIFRSSDSINFTKIGSIEGICGSSAEEIDYDFTDLFPEKNTRNYYRLSLGGLEFSWIISIHVVDIPANAYLVVPNPLISEAQLFFENAAFASCQLTIYSPSGAPIFEEVTSGAFFLLRKEEFSSGIYFFRISYDNGKESIAGRFAVY